jgi:hypothetical protein
MMASLPAHAGLPAPNPWLTPSPYAISHRDPAQTDSADIDDKRRNKQDWRLLFNTWLMYWKLQIKLGGFFAVKRYDIGDLR